MGHKSSKKRAEAAKESASIILASTSSASTSEVHQEQSKTESHTSTSEVRQEQSKTESHASIVTECKLALDAREHGEPDKALSILKKAYIHHESCAALAYHIESSVLKQIELGRAIESSDRAVWLSPNSLQFAVHYARVLYEAKAYEKAIQECKRAFSIDNPIDPVKDTIPGEREERRYKHPLTAEERIAYVKEELQDLLQKSEKRRNEEQRKEIMEKMKQEHGLRTEIKEEDGKLKDTFEHYQKQLADQNENPGAGGPSQRVLEDGILKFDNRKLKGKMEEEGKLEDTLEYQQKQLADQNENPAAVKEQPNKQIQGRMHVETREKLVNKVKEQLNKEIQDRMNQTKELDMENGQLNNEIQERMNRTKELDMENGQLNNEIQERMNRTKELDMEKGQLNNEIQERMNQTKELNIKNGQLNNEIQERMNRSKELDMEKGQLNKEIQQRIDRIKQLDKEVEEDELGYLSF